ncbi:DUF2972 domain-containing protein [Helicobacter saguini]|uniref:DUF2972 domain-containing protein n=1 Tax=Helicobacter saguini TaxID=1548018 RepID=A0A4U8T632_9HELI|nr:DUF2972 domain-containing protein [Helicobacter saguini]MWV62378.1 DUF2972 domain-containing protein [Helicobacter saguini]MWV66950.1 DUF2972 domain-containing protein [Helicobacter saguini]MWV71146.1 DUF2972 domain-containing protein [Helicobacter saguini]TLD94963.1 DUF2972 domain-containing protein [Helicobacter saguini]
MLETKGIITNENKHALTNEKTTYFNHENIRKDLSKMSLDSIKYVYKMLDLKHIESYLDSKDFKEKYAKNPYPPLVNLDLIIESNNNLKPSKINSKQDSKQKQYSKFIPYHKIPKDLTFALNLPFPPTYNFIWLQKDSSASAAFTLFLSLCEVNFIICYSDYEVQNYDILQNTNTYNILNIHQHKPKIHYLVDKKSPIIFIVRDPISILKTALNHFKDFENFTPLMRKFNLTCDYTKLIPKTIFVYSKESKPTLDSIKNVSFSVYFNTHKRLKILKDFTSEIICLDFSDFSSTNAFNTMENLSIHLGFKKPIQKESFEGLAIDNLEVLPAKLMVNESDINNVFNPQNSQNTQNLDSLNSLDSIEILITTHQKTPNFNDYDNITQDIFGERELMFKNMIFLTKDSKKLQKNELLYKKVKEYLNGYLDTLEKSEKEKRASFITESQIINYLKDNKDLREKLKAHLKDDLQYVLENHPDYVKKWKYYNELMNAK